MNAKMIVFVLCFGQMVVAVQEEVPVVPVRVAPQATDIVHIPGVDYTTDDGDHHELPGQVVTVEEGINGLGVWRAVVSSADFAARRALQGIPCVLVPVQNRS